LLEYNCEGHELVEDVESKAELAEVLRLAFKKKRLKAVK
jgi:hypothetical protein